MFGVAGAWAFLFEHPIVGLVVFIAVSGGVVSILSGGKLAESLGGIFRVFLTIFSTPFVFLRDALAIVGNAGESEQDYRKSRVFMLFRLSRIQYMGLLVLCLLTLSSGITSSLITLYPAAEIAQGKALKEAVVRLQADLVTAHEAAASVSAPGFVEKLEAAKDEARIAYQQRAQSNVAMVQNTAFTGPLINQLAYARNVDTVVRTRENIDNYMSGCPRGYSWRGMTDQSCQEYRAFVLELANRKAEEIRLSEAAADAERAWREAGSAAENAKNNVATAQANLDYAKQQQKDASLFNPDMMGRRIASSILGLLGTLGSVIVLVWFGATAISILSWIILMMRSLELSQTEAVERRRSAAEDQT